MLPKIKEQLKELIKLNLKSNKTYMPCGKKGKKK